MQALIQNWRKRADELKALGQYSAAAAYQDAAKELEAALTVKPLPRPDALGWWWAFKLRYDGDSDWLIVWVQEGLHGHFAWAYPGSSDDLNEVRANSLWLPCTSPPVPAQEKENSKCEA